MDVLVNDIKKYGAISACVLAWCKINLSNEWTCISSKQIADIFNVHEKSMQKYLNDMISQGELERKLSNNANPGVKGTNGSVAYYRLGC